MKKRVAKKIIKREIEILNNTENKKESDIVYINNLASQKNFLIINNWNVIKTKTFRDETLYNIRYTILEKIGSETLHV